jgi:hypothetical protein
MRKVTIFGLQDYSELAHYYLTHDSTGEVVAFSVHREYLPPDGNFLQPFTKIGNNVYKGNPAENLAISSTKMRF